MSDRLGMPLVTLYPEMEASIRKRRLQMDLDNRFKYHAPKGDQAQRYTEIRGQALAFALILAETCPESRELSTALTKLDEVVFFANASIARNE
jgi:hypothetical protein